MKFPINWQVRSLDSLTSLVATLTKFHTISSHINLQRTQQNPLSIYGPDPLSEVLSKVEVHVPDFPFVADKRLLLVLKLTMFYFKNIRKRVLDMVMKFVDMGSCLLRLPANIFHSSSHPAKKRNKYKAVLTFKE